MEVILSTLRSWTVVELVYFTPQAIEPLGGWASKPVQNTRYVGTEHQSFRGLKPEIPSSVYREQWQITESDSATDAHFEKLVLVEAVVSYADERFTMKDLGHSVDVPGFRRHVQRAHDEALLSAAENTLIDRRMSASMVPVTFDLLFTFTSMTRRVLSSLLTASLSVRPSSQFPSDSKFLCRIEPALRRLIGRERSKISQPQPT